MSVVQDVLENSKTVAIVGLSPKEGRPSLAVAIYLKEHGYKVIPVNPSVDEVIGEKSYPDLISIPEKVDVVDVFRKPEDVVAIAEEAIKIGAKVLWMQLEISNAEAAKMARDAGLLVVQDHCIKKEHEKMTGVTKED